MRNYHWKGWLTSFGLNNKDKWEYELIKATGIFTEHKFFVLRTKDGRFGYLMIQGFIPNNDKDSIIWVNRGWIPLDKKLEFETNSHLSSPITIFGLLKKAEHLEVRKKDRDLYEHSSDFHIIDLDRFQKQVKYNKSFDSFFIEQIINDADENDVLYPCPSTRYNYNKPYLTPQKHIEYSTFWGICTSIGVISLIKILIM